MYENDYVKGLNNGSAERCSSQIRAQEFEKTFKARVEQGMTLNEFVNTYNTTAGDIAMFETLQKKVAEEKKLGDAFLQGFNEC